MASFVGLEIWFRITNAYTLNCRIANPTDGIGRDGRTTRKSYERHD